MVNSEISRNDMLALERTKLANERTSLAYFRTFMVFLGSGIAILKIGLFDDLRLLGYFFIIAALIILLIGLARFFYVKAKLDKYYN